jgi:DNA-binding transcriptional ArsR family regulator
LGVQVADQRVLILYALEKKRLCVNELAAEVGLTQPATSRHLRVLRERGLVTTGRQGQSIYYALGDRRLIEVHLVRAVLASQLAASEVGRRLGTCTEAEMKFGVMVLEGPYQHQAADSAYYFVRAALARGHQIVGIFLFADGVATPTM